MLRRSAHLLPVILLMVLQATAQHEKKGNSPASQFTAAIQTAMQQWKTPGLSVVVVHNGSVVFNKGFGVSDQATGAPFTTSTLAVCASTTKAMTAVCMGMLVDAGNLRWEHKVSDIYPAFQLYDAYAGRETTIKDLFTHNAGLGNADWLWVFDYPVDSIVRRLRFLQPAYSFRSSFIYQNIMYIVAGEVIRKVSGMSWESFINQRLFAPLGMHHTYPQYASIPAGEPRIAPHFMYNDSIVRQIPFSVSPSVGAAGGVWSCTDDMARWMQFMLDSGKVRGKPLISAETWSMLLQPQVVVPENQFYPTRLVTSPSFMTYGIGWFQQDYRGELLQFHTGSLDGVVAIAGLVPGQQFGVYIFSNLDHAELRHALMFKAIDLFLYRDNSRDWVDLCFALYKAIGEEEKGKRAALAAQRVTGTMPTLPQEAYTGRYLHPVFGTADVVLRGGDLYLAFPNNTGGRLSHWNYDTYMLDFSNDWWGKMPVGFSVNWQGKVTSFAFDGQDFTKTRD